MKKLKLVAPILFTCVIATNVHAQPNPGPGNPGSNITATNDGPVVPFDGGMSLILLASGVGYASRKIKAIVGN